MLNNDFKITLQFDDNDYCTLNGLCRITTEMQDLCHNCFENEKETCLKW